MHWPCTFHVVCTSFSALATWKLANTNADSGEIRALVSRSPIYQIKVGIMLYSMQYELCPYINVLGLGLTLNYDKCLKYHRQFWSFF